MTYENFIEKIKESDININPCLPLNIDRHYWYENEKPKNGRFFIAQYWVTGGITGNSCWGRDERSRKPDLLD